MVKTESRFDVERVKKLGDAKYGTRWADRVTWARVAGVSYPTLFAFLDGRSVRLDNIDKIIAPFGLGATDIIVRKNGKKAS